MGRRQKFSVKTAQALERRDKVVSMRARGMDYHQIAAELKCSPSQAWKDCQAAVVAFQEHFAERINEQRAMDASLIEQIVRTLTPAALCGDLNVTIVLLKVLERRAKLLGLDISGPMLAKDDQGQTIIDQLRLASQRADEMQRDERVKKLGDGKIIEAELEENDKT